MSNVDRVREIYEAINERGLEAAIDRFHPDFEATVPPELSAEPDSYRGHEGLRRYFAGFEGSLEDVRMEPVEFVEHEGRVLVPIRLTARGADSGIEVEQRVVQAWSFQGGKVIRVDGHTDLDNARAEPRS